MTLAENILKTPLFSLHQELGAKMVPFAGYAMPVQYPSGVLSEHLFTRESAGLFDVSHMGQAFLTSLTDKDIGKIFERLVPGNIAGLGENKLRYTLFLNEDGGIMDDLMATRFGELENTLYLVVNAACKDADFAHISAKLGGEAKLEILDDRALLALQGPKAEEVLSKLWPGAKDLTFMTSGIANLEGHKCFISRSGYTGEDGYEISVPEEGAEKLARKLLSFPEVKPIGLGARDSLRLEAGLCLYGHDLDETTSPVEGGLVWAVAKARREIGDFPGASRILKELKEGPKRKRVGIKPLTRAPAREGTEVVDNNGAKIGVVTSGGFGPSYGGPVAMGYVSTEFSEIGNEVGLNVREKILPAEVIALPFYKKSYKR
ncbi:MAG: glycine cleavage system aminomethyltransferase GcvT [Alphaproteobacteria bacterium]